MIRGDLLKPIKVAVPLWFGPIYWGMSAQAFFPSHSVLASYWISFSLSHSPTPLLLTHSWMFPYMAAALCSQRMTSRKWWTEWGSNSQSIALLLPTRGMPWCIVANTALFQLFSLSCDVSIFPSILPSLFLLCVIAGHVTPSHLRTVVASPRVYYYSDQIIVIGFREWNVLCRPFCYIFFCCVFLIRASFSYRMRIQNEIIYRKHWVRTPCPWQSASNRNEVRDASIRANNPSWSLFSFPHVHLIVLDLPALHASFKFKDSTYQTFLWNRLSGLYTSNVSLICGLVCPPLWLLHFFIYCFLLLSTVPCCVECLVC